MPHATWQPGRQPAPAARCRLSAPPLPPPAGGRWTVDALLWRFPGAGRAEERGLSVGKGTRGAGTPAPLAAAPPPARDEVRQGGLRTRSVGDDARSRAGGTAAYWQEPGDSGRLR